MRSYISRIQQKFKPMMFKNKTLGLDLESARKKDEQNLLNSSEYLRHLCSSYNTTKKKTDKKLAMLKNTENSSSVLNKLTHPNIHIKTMTNFHKESLKKLKRSTLTSQSMNRYFGKNGKYENSLLLTKEMQTNLIFEQNKLFWKRLGPALSHRIIPQYLNEKYIPEEKNKSIIDQLKEPISQTKTNKVTLIF